MELPSDMGDNSQNRRPFDLLYKWKERIDDGRASGIALYLTNRMVNDNE